MTTLKERLEGKFKCNCMLCAEQDYPCTTNVATIAAFFRQELLALADEVQDAHYDGAALIIRSKADELN